MDTSKIIFLCKESNGTEKRVALIPEDVKVLCDLGYTVFVEHTAGVGAHFSDHDYIEAGAQIRPLREDSVEGFKDLFNGVDIIVRAKRPNKDREALEARAYSPETIMIGALDPHEPNSTHIDGYHKAKIKAYSLDQIQLPQDDPMNLLASMSKIAGKLALLDAIKIYAKTPHEVLIVGFGVAGRAAFNEALSQKLKPIVVSTHLEDQKEIENAKAQFLHLDKSAELAAQQDLIIEAAKKAQIIITSARAAGKKAPVLFPASSLQKLAQDTVIVDLALSEGGNVENSVHDQTLTLPNNIRIHNVSGYPKAQPKEASILWSQATTAFIRKLFSKDPPPLKPC